MGETSYLGVGIGGGDGGGGGGGGGCERVTAVPTLETSIVFSLLAKGRRGVGSFKDPLFSSTVDEAIDFKGDGEGTKLPLFCPKKGGGGGGGGGREVIGCLTNDFKVEDGGGGGGGAMMDPFPPKEDDDTSGDGEF